MSIKQLPQRLAIGSTLITLSIFTTTGINAQCVAHPRSGNALAPEFRRLQEPAPPDVDSSSDQLGSPESLGRERDEPEANVLGLWKKIYYAGGALNDVGFAQFNGGGTELLNDSPVPDGGNNFCMGAWKKIGRRRYTIVHPYLLFDESGKKPVGVSIERSELIVSRDGNTFRGKWNQDNYDFEGNVIPNTHFQGIITGTRIAPDISFPFPFPF